MLSPDRPSEVTIPLSIAVKIIPDLPRASIEALINSLIDCLDQEDGDVDIEPNGDELDGSSIEEDIPIFTGDTWVQIGCPVSDPPEDEGDQEQAAWLERIDQREAPYPDPVTASYRNGEDVEDDDPDCGIEDEPHDDAGEAEEEEGISPPAYGLDQRLAPMLGDNRWDIDTGDYAARERTIP